MQTGAPVHRSVLQGSSRSKQPYSCKLPMLQRSAAFSRPSRLCGRTTPRIRAHSKPSASQNSSSPSSSRHSRCLQDSTGPGQEKQPLHVVLTSVAAAAAVTLSSLLAPELALLGPGAAAAKPRMTPDEQVTIDIFKRSTPSVVNVTNLTAR
jgi:hypothetical protein